MRWEQESTSFEQESNRLEQESNCLHQVQKSECNLVLHIVISKHVHSEPDNQKALGIMKVKKDTEEKKNLEN